MNQTVVVFLEIIYFGVSKKNEHVYVKTVDGLYVHKILRVTKERKYFSCPHQAYTEAIAITISREHNEKIVVDSAESCSTATTTA